MRKIDAFEGLDGRLYRDERECLVADLAHKLAECKVLSLGGVSLPSAVAERIANNLPDMWPILTRLNEPRNQKAPAIQKAIDEDAHPDIEAAPVQQLDDESIHGSATEILEEAARPLRHELRVGQQIEDDSGIIATVQGFGADEHGDVIMALHNVTGFEYHYRLEEIKRVVTQPEDNMDRQEAQEALDAINAIEGELSPLDRTRRILLHRRIEQLDKEPI